MYTCISMDSTIDDTVLCVYFYGWHYEWYCFVRIFLRMLPFCVYIFTYGTTNGTVFVYISGDGNVNFVHMCIYLL